MTINWDDLLTAPSPVELTPQEEIEKLEAQIADEQENMRAYASNPRVCVLSQAKIQLLETEIAKWKAAIYSAEQEAFDREQKLARMQKDLLPETRVDLGRVLRAMKQQKARDEGRQS